MTSTQPTVRKEYIILKYSIDWADWYNQLYQYAVLKEVWQYINPNSTEVLLLRGWNLAPI